MADAQTFSDLYKAKCLTDDDLTTAVAGYLADPTPGPRAIVEGVSLDIAAAVKANQWARILVSAPSFTPAQRQMAVRTAILLAKVG
ncbi:hypothetical protein [Methylobacterium isbiliense]|uniref:Uncharacterized protein n=1 Tax=Methylobacterium isbiliense TaxID=315478 RepID=A0ABQ4SM82_9HYPH|nr:hypothetical protein [Methylobacterium isbiliense]MDN3626459.1 hypothetical protein [Methylobacterium isbiliense]GJE04337.1 hypothetical protein GMJLKIPL_6298 [Methylobacterium isbiliense]